MEQTDVLSVTEGGLSHFWKVVSFSTASWLLLASSLTRWAVPGLLDKESKTRKVGPVYSCRLRGWAVEATRAPWSKTQKAFLRAGK